MENKITLFSYLAIILKHRKFVIILAVIFVAVGAVFSFFNTPTYTAKSSIWSNYPDIMSEVLNDGRVFNRAISSLDLSQNPEALNSLSLSISNNKNISFVGVSSNNPTISAAVANSLVEMAINRYEDVALDMVSQIEEGIKKDIQDQWRFLYEIVRSSDMEKQINLSYGGTNTRSNPPLSVVLRTAKPSTKIAKPISDTIRAAVSSGLIGLLFGILIAFFLEYLAKHKDSWKAFKREYITSKKGNK